MFDHRSLTRPLAALFLLPLLFLCGCSQNQLYVITDEPGGTTIGGIPLTDADVEALASSEAEARALQLEGKYREAAEVYNRQLPILAGHFIAEYKIAAAYANAGDVDKSLDWLEQAVKKGFANVGKMDTDPALEILHSEERAVPIYRGTRENMIALRSKIQLDPWTAPVGTAASFNDLPALLAAYQKEEDQLDQLENVFFPRESALRLILTHCSKAAALEAFIAGGHEAGETEEARVELLRLYRRHTQGPRLSAVAEAKLDEDCRSYIGDYADGQYLPEVKLIHAEYRFLSGLRSLAGPRREQIPRLCDEFRAEAEEIIATAPQDPAAGLALAWLTELDFDPRYGQRDLAGAQEKYRQLTSDYIAMPGVADQAQRISALRFFDEGIPAFEVAGIDGEPITPENYEGKVLLLYFWATTSKPAKDEISNLKWIEEKFQKDGVAVVGVSLDKGDLLSAADFSRWVEANNISWPQYYDGLGQDNQLASLFGVSTVPYVFVINRDGTLADAGLTGKDLELAVATVLE